MCFNAGLAHILIQKTRTLQLFAFRTRNIDELLDQAHRVIGLERVNDFSANVFFD